MLHAMRTGDMKQEMGTGPWAFKGRYRQLQVVEAWSYLPLVRRSLSNPRPDPDSLADPRWSSLGSPTLSSSQA